MIRIATVVPKFEPGHLIRHRRYAYRGVVIALDQECAAPESWYQSNQTQPPRQQPWYHVLVHETGSVTYAAQDSLIADSEELPIEHPLLEVYFSGFCKNRYLRNEKSWEGW